MPKGVPQNRLTFAPTLKHKMTMKRKLTLSCLLVCALVAQAQVQQPDSLNREETYMDSLYQTLPEVMVMGERPVVKAEDGKLVYDLPRIISDKPVTSIYEAIRELPGVTENGGSFMLGGRGATVVLDGKVTTLSPEQLTALLRSMPANRIKNAEVMYNAPARYQVRGALINITLNKQTDGTWPIQGEVMGKVEHRHETTYQQRISLLYNKGRFSADLLYSHDHGRQYGGHSSISHHTLADGTVHDIQTHQENHNRFHDHSLRLGADYAWTDKHRLSLVYNNDYAPSHTWAVLSGSVEGSSAYDQSHRLHNLRADYELPVGLKAGAEFTYYKAPSTQKHDSNLWEESQLHYLIHDDQQINKWKGFLSGEHKLGNDWSINYGAIYANTLDKSYQYYTKTDESSADLPDDKSVRKREQRLDLYAGFTKPFAKLTLDASLDAEHYKSLVWDQWKLYPNLNLTYQPNNTHFLQFGLSSNNSYPDYWSMAAYTSYMDGGYSEIIGNPTLKPMNDYQLQLVYMLHSKYTFVLWYDHMDDFFTQTLYQRSDRLVLNYKHLNSDFNDQIGLQAAIPVKPFKWWEGRITAVAVYNRQKDSDFYDLPYDRHVIWTMLNLRNTITLSKKPDLTMQVNGMVRTTAIQGTYDLPSTYNLDWQLRYRFLNSRATLTLWAENIFESNAISPRIRYHGQWIENHYPDFRSLGISFSYAFGGYKAKQREAVDTSRFK